MTHPETTPETRTGGCHCGAVRYEAWGKVFNATVCHCTLCRGTTGAPAVAWFSVEATHFRLTRGQPQSYRSTPRGNRTFCAACGTQLTFREDGETAIDITTASLDEPAAAAVAPRDQTYARSALPWMDGLQVLPRIAASRDRG